MTTRLMGLLFAAMLAGAACGGAEAVGSDEVATIDDVDSSTETNEAGEVDSEAQLLAFAQCLRGEGFDVSDPTVDSDGNVVPGGLNNDGTGEGRPDGFAEARDACSEFLEDVTLGRQNQDQTESLDQQLEFTACMRENGFDLPDPDAGVGGGRVLQGVDRSDPAYQAAFANCDDILASAGGRGGN